MSTTSGKASVGVVSIATWIGFLLLFGFAMLPVLTDWSNTRDVRRLDWATLSHESVFNRYSYDYQRDRAEIAIYKLPYQPELALASLNSALALQPMDALSWLNAAEFHALEDEPEAARTAMATAEQLWPTSAPLLWRNAMLSVRLGDNEDALERLTRYVALRPKRILDSYAIAQRLLKNPSSILAKFVNQDAISRQTKDVMIRSLAKRGLNTRSLPLSTAIAVGYGEHIAEDKKTISHLATLLWREKDFDSLGALWRTLDGTERRAGTIENGGFESDIGGHVYGWFVHSQDGISAQLDDRNPFNGKSSLSLNFDGTANDGFVTVRQLIPISTPGAYTLSGYWRGVNITTLSGVYIDVVAWNDEDGVVVDQIPEQRESWSWTKFTLEFNLSESINFIEIRTRRRKSSNLDNKIAGTVWFDEIRLAGG